MNYPLIEHGGHGSALHWGQATGFPLSTYRPILDALAGRYRCVTVPPRALWPDAGPPPPTVGDWADYARDIIEGLAQHGISQAVLVGHSFTGVASLIAAVRHRPAVRALALLDPTIFSPAKVEAMGAAKAAGWNPPHPLAPRARERRSEFASREEAFRFWREKPLFADWSDESLTRYVEGGLSPTNGKFRLRWTPEWEAYNYESFHPDSWRAVRQLDPAIPVLVVGGEHSDTTSAETLAVFQELAPHATVKRMPQGGHLFPQAFPERTAAVLDEWLSSVDSS